MKPLCFFSKPSQAINIGNATNRGLQLRKKRNLKCSMELDYVPHEIYTQLSGISQWTYKSQQSVERGFWFLKSPEFMVSSLFLKKPERIEALLMVMTLCLLVYAAIQHRIRHELKRQSRFFPDMKRKPCHNPTARWVFFCFQGINVLLVDGHEKHVVGLQERQLIIISILGRPYREIYS